jgi:hypothetical protein
VVFEEGVGVLGAVGQRNPGLEPVLAAGNPPVFVEAAFGVSDARARRHPVDRPRLDGGDRAGGISDRSTVGDFVKIRDALVDACRDL